MKEAFGAHAKTTGTGTFNLNTEFDIPVDAAGLATFTTPSDYYWQTIKLTDLVGKVQSVVCKGVSGNAFHKCKGGVGNWAVNTPVYIGAPTPINLHVIAGQAKTHYWVTTFGPQPQVCTVGSSIKLAHQTNPVVDFFQQKSMNMPIMNGLAYHYALFGHFSNCDGCDTCVPSGQHVCDGLTGSRPDNTVCQDSFGTAPAPFATGIASVYGPDIIISLARNDRPCTEDFVRVEAGTILHELGHNLSLNHGGFEDTANFKPNYMSVMNYHYQYTGMSTWAVDSSSALSYSDSVNPDLDETNLIEADGFPYSPAHGSLYYESYADYANGGFASARGDVASVNWNGDSAVNDAEGLSCNPAQGAPNCCDFGDTDCSVLGGPQPPNVSCENSDSKCHEMVDTNRDGSTLPLKDLNDWQKLELRYQCSTAYLPGAPPCSLTASSSTAQTLTRHCYIDSEYSTVQAVHDGVNITPPITVTAEPQKACLDPQSHGVIPLYVNGKKTFDVTKVVLASLRFATAPVNNATACSIQDHNGDGFPDLKCQFRQDQTNLHNGSTTACIVGVMIDSTKFSACFPIQIKNDPLNPCN